MVILTYLHIYVYICENAIFSNENQESDAHCIFNEFSIYTYTRIHTMCIMSTWVVRCSQAWILCLSSVEWKALGFRSDRIASVNWFILFRTTHTHTHWLINKCWAFICVHLFTNWEITEHSTMYVNPYLYKISQCICANLKIVNSGFQRGLPSCIIYHTRTHTQHIYSLNAPRKVFGFKTPLNQHVLIG